MLFVIGVLVGVLLGLTGAGGSVFAVPLLLLLTHMPIADASGIALAAVALAAIVGVVIQFTKAQVLWRPALLMAVTGAALAPFGRFVATMAPDIVVLSVFAITSLGISAWMWATSEDSKRVMRGRVEGGADSASAACRFGQGEALGLGCYAYLLVAGAIVGFLSGFMGVGGGFIIVPVLLWLTRLPMIYAVGSSLVIIAIVSTSGFISHWLLHTAPIAPALQLVVGAVLGMLLSHRVARQVTSEHLQKAFAVALCMMCILVLGVRGL